MINRKHFRVGEVRKYSISPMAATNLCAGIGRVVLGVLLARWAAAQTPPTLAIQTLSTGLAPLGVDIAATTTGQWTWTAAVANSGEDSVSLFALNVDLNNPPGPKTIFPLESVSGIPRPYAVAACPNGLVVVTSPADNSISVVQAPGGTVLGRVHVGARPNAVACFARGAMTMAAVSNVGDNSLSIVNVSALSVVSTVQNVPGARGLHGIAIYRNQVGNGVAWVGGTDASIVTLVDLGIGSIVAKFPHPSPRVVRLSQSPREVLVTSTSANNITYFNAETLQINGTSLPDTPNAQDYLSSGLGSFYTIGGQDAIGWSGGIISNVPGASGLATTSFAFNPLLTTSVVLATSTDSNSVLLIQRAPNAPRQFTVSNAASFVTASVAPGQLASISTSTGVSQNLTATFIPLPMTLGGVRLKIGGTLSFDPFAGWTYSPVGSTDAALLFVGPSLVYFQVPPGIALGNAVPAQLIKADGSALLSTLNITTTAPGIFTVFQSGIGQAAVLNEDYSQNGSPVVIWGAKPATRGTVIHIFATGGGGTTPALLPGEAAPSISESPALTNVQPTVTIGGQPATVQFSGMAPGFVGLWQINARVPENVSPGSAVPLVVSAGGVSSNTVTIAVQ